MRKLVLLIFLFGTFSVGAELLLVGHVESFWQLLPLVLIAASLVALVFHAVVENVTSIKVFQVLMLLFILSGFVGVGQHYQAKIEFKLEINPSLSGLELFREALTGSTVPPVLAPGMMLQLGLLGLAFTYRHPVLLKTAQKSEPTTNGE